jgi:multisubunit Na+/H+ antiporter MnhE subunit
MGWLVLLRNRFNEYGFLVTGLLVGFFSLIFTHMFSPYLNHPLGIGYLLMLIGIFQALRHQTKAI